MSNSFTKFCILFMLIAIIRVATGVQTCDTKEPVECSKGYCVVTSFSKSKAYCVSKYCKKDECCKVNGKDVYYSCNKGRCKEVDDCRAEAFLWEFWVGGGFFALVILGVCLWFVLKKRKQKRALQQNNNIGGGVQMEQPMVNNGQRSSLEANQTAHVPVQNARDLQGAPVAYGQYNPSAGRQPQKMYPNLDGNSNSNGRYNQDPGPNQV
mmetsp:Transcript_10214/g.11113  ORF Transcript_10214/g.11113 Transcript_10214/m.11113 type:complete len:209 (+) Transcript_10214:50-676(+)